MICLAWAAIFFIDRWYQTTLLVSLASLLLLAAALDGRDGDRRLLGLCGVAAGLAFFTKQSTGLLVVVACVGIVALVRWRAAGVASAARAVLAICCGIAIPSGSILGWLWVNDALSPWFSQVFLSGSKGTLREILTGFVPRLLDTAPVLPGIGMTVAVVLLLLLGRTEAARPAVRRVRPPRRALLLLGLVFVAASIMLAYSIPYAYPLRDERQWFASTDIGADIVLVTFLSLLVIVPMDVVRMLRDPRSPDARRDLLGTGFGLVWMFGHGMSGVLETPALLPAGAIVGVRWIEAIRGRWSQGVARSLLLGGGLWAVTRIAGEHYERPYYWWGWGEYDVRNSTATSTLPALRGLTLSPRTVAILDGATTLIEANTSESDEVFFFPHIALFNVLANRTHGAFAAVNYFDVCSDAMARATADYLTRRPPRMIVTMDFPEVAWQTHETIFRNGARSGQREIQAMIDEGLRAGRYRELARAQREKGYPIRFLVRVDDGTSAPASLPDRPPPTPLPRSPAQLPG